MKTQYFHQIKLLCYGEVLWFFTLRPSDLNTTLTYILMDNFFPCLLHAIHVSLNIECVLIKHIIHKLKNHNKMFKFIYKEGWKNQFSWIYSVFA